MPYAQTPSTSAWDAFTNVYTGVLDLRAKFIAPVVREPVIATVRELRAHISEYLHAGRTSDVWAPRVRQAAALLGYENGPHEQARAALVRYVQILRAWEALNTASTDLADLAEEVEAAEARAAAANEFALVQHFSIYAADVELQLVGGAR